MELYNLKAAELSSMLCKKEVSATEVVSAYLEHIAEKDHDICAYLTLCEDSAKKEACIIDSTRIKGEKLHPLAGVPIAVKDNICTSGIKTTCASRMLEEFIPPYDATVITRLRKCGMILLGKTNMDEFGMGSTGEHSAFQVTKNPANMAYVPGGSSSGSAAAVAGGLACMALGSDTGGSIRTPAEYCGVVGLKPSYGAVSRYGLIAFASSLEQIGILARDVSDASLFAKVLYGKDPLDNTCIETPISCDTYDLSKLKIGFFPESLNKTTSEIRGVFENTMELCHRAGAQITPLESKLSEYYLSIYYILSSAEASSNLARYDGIKYGFTVDGAESIDELMTSSRSGGFGIEVKRRILLGNFVLSQGFYEEYYEKACKARTLVIQEMEDFFEDVDIVLSPVTTACAPKLGAYNGAPQSMYPTDYYTIGANLAGLPALALPICKSVDGLPIGVQILARRGQDAKMLGIARAIESLIGGDRNAI